MHFFVQRTVCFFTGAKFLLLGLWTLEASIKMQMVIKTDNAIMKVK